MAWRLGSVLRGLAGAALVALAAAGAWAQDVLPVPALAERVTDQTTTLDAAQRSALAAKLAALEQQTGAQVAVLIVPTTQPEDITDYAQRVGDAWKLGRKVEGDGALIVVAANDRRVRIVVTKALEGAVPDLAARQIITRHISPAFKAGDYAGGLNAAVDALAARIRGEALPAPQPASRAESLGLEGLAVFMFVAVPIVALVLGGLLGRKLGVLGTAGGTGALAWFFSGSVGLAVLAGVLGLVVALLVGMAGALRSYGPSGSSRLGGRGTGRHHAAPIIWGSGGGWGGGGGGWGGGGGGFSSGGGGDFGGGGASGDW